MNLQERFKEHVLNNNLFSKKDQLLLAVSGGLDSVVLCELCKQSGFHFSIAHCNFQLRGKESDRDEKFVVELGDKYKVEVKVEKFQTEAYAEEKKMSIQEAARELRYRWFFELVNGFQFSLSNGGPGSGVGSQESPGWNMGMGNSYLLTAHHADDNVETVLMNFFRGTGLHGLTGIPAIASWYSMGFIRRPLLPFSKEELRQFAQHNKLNWVEDSSNQSSKYTRNLFRNEIIPAVARAYPQVNDNLRNNIERFKEIEKLYTRLVGMLKDKICREKGEELHIPIKQLMEYKSRALIYEIASPYGFNERQIDEIIKLADADSGSYIASAQNDFRIIKHRHWFIIAPAVSSFAETIIIEKDIRRIHFTDGTLMLERISRLPANSTSQHEAFLDESNIGYPLLLRRWRTGDYFYPLGMRKKKKLGRFFIDQKLSKTDKEKIWVIEMNKKIIWVVGHRIDDRFRVTDNTSSILKLTLHFQTG